MKTILFTIICVISLLWVGDLTITFKPFSISFPGWYKPVGTFYFFCQWRYIPSENMLKAINRVSIMG